MNESKEHTKISRLISFLQNNDDTQICLIGTGATGKVHLTVQEAKAIFQKIDISLGCKDTWYRIHNHQDYEYNPVRNELRSLPVTYCKKHPTKGCFSIKTQPQIIKRFGKTVKTSYWILKGSVSIKRKDLIILKENEHEKG
jgi:hypothetical protein